VRVRRVKMGERIRMLSRVKRASSSVETWGRDMIDWWIEIFFELLYLIYSTLQQHRCWKELEARVGTLSLRYRTAVTEFSVFQASRIFSLSHSLSWTLPHSDIPSSVKATLINLWLSTLNDSTHRNHHRWSTKAIPTTCELKSSQSSSTCAVSWYIDIAGWDLAASLSYEVWDEVW
jgi:hypothetical protein